MIKNSTIKKVPVLNKVINTDKVRGDEGRPFKEIKDDYTLKIAKGYNLNIFQIKTKVNLENIYKYFNNFIEFRNIHFQIHLGNNEVLLIVKYKDENETVKKLNNLNNDNIKLKKLKVEKYSKILNKILNHQDNTLNTINKKTKSSKECLYNADHIKKENKFFRILEITELPNVLDLSKLKKHTSISIKFCILDNEKKNNVYESVIKNLKGQKNKNKYGYKNIQPYRLKERIKIAKKNQEKNSEILGVDIKFIIKGNNKKELEKRTAKIKELAAASKQRYIIKTLTHEHNKTNFCNVLPINYKSNYTPSFYSKEKINFFVNITTNNSLKNKIPLGNKTINSLEKIKNSIEKNISFLGFDTDKLKTSKSIIPIKELYENGIFELNNSTFSSIIEFKNINYLLERQEDKESILEIYQNFINTVDENISIQLYIKNKDINMNQLKDDLYLKPKENFEQYIKEYNINLKDKLNEVAEQTSKTGYYFIINVKADSIGEASKKIRQTFNNSLAANFTRLNSKVKRLSATETKKLIYDSINNPEETERFIDCLDYQKNLKSKLLSSSYSIKKDHIEQGRKFQQVVYVKKYANKLSDTFLNSIIQLPFTFESSLHIQNLKADKAINKVQNKIVSMESDKLQKKERSESDYVPFELEKNLEEGYYILDKLQYKDQKLFTLSFYITITADTKEEMETNKNILKTVFSRHMCKFDVLKFRQQEGLLSTLPFGIDKLKENRALLTENVKYLHPFDTQNIYHPDGIFYGLSSANKILSVNRKKYQNPSAFFLGVPGSGKSFTAKMEMLSVFFKTNDDIIIIDPEREYGALVEALGGEVIKLSTSTNNYINPMKLSSEGYTKDNISTKIEFLITFLEKLTGEQLRSSSKSVVDRVLRKIYKEFKTKNEEPVLKDFYNELMQQEEEISKRIALDLEIYIKGSLDIFAQKSNITTNNRIVCYDIKDLKDQLKTPALTAILDSIWDTFSKNRAKGKYTWLYIDEIYLLFNNESSSEWLFETWKRIRKYLGVITGITQNISDLLQSHTSSTMLSNSEFKLILNQAAEDRKILVDFLGISENQKNAITNAQIGTGLLMAENNVVPFSNRINPDDIPELFELINTSYGG